MYFDDTKIPSSEGDHYTLWNGSTECTDGDVQIQMYFDDTKFHSSEGDHSFLYPLHLILM